MRTQVICILIMLLSSITNIAQSPESINYQAIVRDVSGNTIINQNIGIQISILQGSAIGTALYVESFSLTTNSYGLINMQIGTGSVQSGSFSGIDWSNGPYFVESSYDVNGGTNYTLSATSEFVSVPYALHSKSVDTSFINQQINTIATDDQNINGSNLSGNDLTIGIENGNSETVDLSSLVDDADADPTNEYNTNFVLNGTNIEITDGGGTQILDLSSLLTTNNNLWYESWDLVTNSTGETGVNLQNYIYFHGFICQATGDYTNVKVRVRNHTSTTTLYCDVYSSNGSWSNPQPVSIIGSGASSIQITNEDDLIIDVPIGNANLIKNNIYFIALKWTGGTCTFYATDETGSVNQNSLVWRSQSTYSPAGLPSTAPTITEDIQSAFWFSIYGN